MSYLALARKWRPRKFEDVLGQPHVVKALSHALAADKLHPAILLTGTRGVGKTTLARIVAKCLNCEKGVSANPCGVCSACKEIDEGRYVDLFEIDAASNTGVDNVRDLIENAQYAPARGRYKVYLIDEVHMLSKGAFNALLKTLEEPPPHVKFILATTDPQKLPVTVLSRCLQFNLKRLPAALIRERLGAVLKEEGLAGDAGALAELARAADGSMRDGLSLLDQAIAFCGGKLERKAVEDMLGTIGRQALYDILNALGAADGKALLAAIEKLDAQAPDYAALLSALAGTLQRIAVLQLLPDARGDDDEDAVVALASTLAPEDVQLYYQIAVAGRRDLPWAPDPRLGFEMTLLRMLAFRPDGAVPGSSPGGGARTPSAARGSAAGNAPPVSAAPSASAGGVNSFSMTPAASASDLDWNVRIEALGLEGFIKQFARHCAWGGQAEGTVTLLLPVAQKHWLQDDRRLALEQALAGQMGAPVKLQIEVREGALPTPAELDRQAMDDRQKAAEAAIEADPAVRMLKERLGATVRPGSVQPRDS